MRTANVVIVGLKKSVSVASSFDLGTGGRLGRRFLIGSSGIPGLLCQMISVGIRLILTKSL